VIPSKWFSSHSCRIRSISVGASTWATFWGKQRMGTRHRHNFFNPTSLWRIYLIIARSSETAAQVLGHWEKTFKGIPQVAVPRSMAVARSLEQHYRINGYFETSGAIFWIGTGRMHQLRVCSWVLDGTFISTSSSSRNIWWRLLFLFLYLSSITYFVDMINSEPFVSFENYILRNSWS
jgi:hypothetical protein